MATQAEDFEIRVRQAVAALLRVDLALVKPEAALAGDLKVDSIEFMTVIIGLERTFGVNLPDEEAARLKTIAQVIDAVRRHTAARPSPEIRDAAPASRSVE